MPGRSADKFLPPTMFLAALVGATAVGAAEVPTTPGPQRMVEEITRAVTHRLAESAQRLEADPDYVTEIVKELVVPHIDFPSVAASTLPGSWEGLSNSEQRCVTRGIKDHLVERYARVLMEYEYSSIVTNPVDTVSKADPVYVTQTVTTPHPQPMSIKYEMKFIGGEWKFIDLIVVDVGLIHNYRVTFDYEIERQGIGDFLRTFPQCRER